ncbi:S41 family peptidase [Dyella koreensis]|uniref:Tail specific protease domain-containing protein n=1 Tax=Dyella koreensis TaxID=311235 RepID=A0ABW8KAL8_9GAMM
MLLTSPRCWRAALALCVALPAAAQAAPPATCPPPIALTAAAARDDLELAIRATEAALPNIYWHQTPEAWETAKAQARATIGTRTSEEAFLRTLRVLLYQIGEGHFSVRPSDAVACRYRAALQFPLDVLWRDDGLFVAAGYGDANDIPQGSEILTINGEPHTALLDELYRASPHDGVIRTGVMRDEGARYAAMRWFLRGEERAFHLRIRIPNGSIRDVEVHPVPYVIRPKPPAALSPVAQLQWIDDKTAYLYVPTFSNKRYRAVGANYASTIQAIFDELGARGAERLVLDLRDNGGGSEPNETILFSYLVERPSQKYASVRSRANDLKVTSPSGRVYRHQIYDSDELSTVRKVGADALERLNAPPEGLMTRWSPASPVFTGKLVVLAGGITFSGGAELASLLYASRRGVFVGEEVGGTHAGNTSGYKWELKLPHSGMEIGIPLLKFRFTWPEVQHDHGALPDCKVQPRVGERRQIDDAAYRVALALLAMPWTQPRGVMCPAPAEP